MILPYLYLFYFCRYKYDMNIDVVGILSSPSIFGKNEFGVISNRHIIGIISNTIETNAQFILYASDIYMLKFLSGLSPVCTCAWEWVLR